MTTGDGRSTRVPIPAAAVWGSAVVAGLVAILGPARPTGTDVGDALWSFAFAAGVALAGASSGPASRLWLTTIAALVCVSGDTVAVLLGVGSLALSLLMLRPRWASAPLGALTAGGAACGLLWAPPYGFTGLASIVAVAAVAPVLWASWSASSPRARRLVVRGGVVAGAFLVVATALAALAAVMVRDDLTMASDRSEEALDLLSYDDLQPSAGAFADAAAAFRSSSDVLNGPLGRLAGLVPIVGPNVEAARRLADSGEHLTSAAARAADAADYQTLTNQNGTVDLAALRSMREPVAQSAEAVHEAERTIEDLESPWLVPPIRDQMDKLADRLREHSVTADQVTEALRLSPMLLGSEREMRYLLALATPSETRGAGGYIGSFGVLTLSGGRPDLSDIQSTLTKNVDPGGTPRSFDPPPDWQERYSSYYVEYFPGNISASPDWPTDTAVALDVYPQIDGVGPLDGALYLDPEAFAALLSLTGPISLPETGLQLDQDNIVEYLLYGQYARFEDNEQRRDVLADVARTVFEVLTSRPLPSPKALNDALGPAVAGGHLRMSVTDARSEAYFDELGLSGRWDPTPGADYLSIRSVDLLSNKLDFFVDRSIDVEVTIDPDTGQLRSRVELTVSNDAPREGLPQYVAGFGEGPYQGVVRDAFELYSPLELEDVTIDGAAAPVQRQREFGGNVFSVPIDVPPGQSRSIVWELRGSVMGSYQLDVIPQPLARDDLLRVRIGSGSSSAQVVFDGPQSETLQLGADSLEPIRR